MAATDLPKGMDYKQPSEVLPVYFDWAPTLAAYDNDTITAALVTCADVTITLGDTNVAPTRVEQWLEDGISGRTYKLTCGIDTAGGLHLEREMWVPCREK